MENQAIKRLVRPPMSKEQSHHHDLLPRTMRRLDFMRLSLGMGPDQNVHTRMIFVTVRSH